jgi:hypothetical protein
LASRTAPFKSELRTNRQSRYGGLSPVLHREIKSGQGEGGGSQLVIALAENPLAFFGDDYKTRLLLISILKPGLLLTASNLLLMQFYADFLT